MDRLNEETARANTEQANWMSKQLQEASGLLYRLSCAVDQLQEQLRVAKTTPVVPVEEPMEVTRVEPPVVVNPQGLGLTFGIGNFDYTVRSRSAESPARPRTSAEAAGTSRATETPPRPTTIGDNTEEVLRVAVEGVRPQLATPNARMAERIAEISSRMAMYGEDDEASDDYEPG